MSPKSKTWKVAFDPITGSHQSFPTAVYDDGEKLYPTMVEPFLFESSLKFIRAIKSRSSYQLIWGDDEGREFTMFVPELVKALEYVVGGRLTGTFGFVKRGDSTSIHFYTPDY